MADKYVMLDFDDPRSETIAEIIGNKTSKKILSLLAEKDMNASDIANELKLPLNTIWYNLDKLVKSGLIEELKGNFWSVKGKKIKTYKLSNKKIVISPKKMTSGLIPTILGVGAIAFLIKLWTNSREKLATQVATYGADASMKMVESNSAAGSIAATQPPVAEIFPTVPISNAWAWFTLGAFIALAIYSAWTLRSKRE